MVLTVCNIYFAFDAVLLVFARRQNSGLLAAKTRISLSGRWFASDTISKMNSVPSALRMPQIQLLPQFPHIDAIPAEPQIGQLPLPVQGGKAPGLKIDPVPSAAIQKAELAKLHVVEGARTPEGNAWAEKLATTKSIPLWLDAAKQFRKSTGFVQGWAGTALVGGAVVATTLATQIAKFKFGRDRPYKTDPTLTTVGPRPRDPSYPSGHTSSSFAAATVFDALSRDLGTQAYDAAKQMAYARVYSGMHYPSDVVAGAKVGASIANTMLKLLPGIDPATTPSATAAPSEV